MKFLGEEEKKKIKQIKTLNAFSCLGILSPNSLLLTEDLMMQVSLSSLKCSYSIRECGGSIVPLKNESSYIDALVYFS